MADERVRHWYEVLEDSLREYHIALSDGAFVMKRRPQYEIDAAMLSQWKARLEQWNRMTAEWSQGRA